MEESILDIVDVDKDKDKDKDQGRHPQRHEHASLGVNFHRIYKVSDLAISMSNLLT